MLKQHHHDDLQRLAKRVDGSGKGLEVASATINSHEKTIFALRGENDQAILAMRQEMDKLKRMQLDALTLKEKQLADERTEYDAARRDFGDRSHAIMQQHEQELANLQREIEMQRADKGLAVKEREMENLNIKHRRELDTLQMRLQQLQQRHLFEKSKWLSDKDAFMHGRDPTASGTLDHDSSSQPNSQASEEFRKLQSEVRKLHKQRGDWDGLMSALTSTYEAKLKKLEAELAKRDDSIAQHFADIEGTRARLESENERYRARLGLLTETNREQAGDLAHLRALKPEMERLRAENPNLTAQVQEFLETKEHFVAENTKMRTERNIWITEMDKVRREHQAISMEAETLRSNEQQYKQDWERIKQDRLRHIVESKKSLKEQTSLRKQINRLSKALQSNNAVLGVDDQIRLSSEGDLSDSVSEESANDISRIDGEARFRWCTLRLFLYLHRHR